MSSVLASESNLWLNPKNLKDIKDSTRYSILIDANKYQTCSNTVNNERNDWTLSTEVNLLISHHEMRASRKPTLQYYQYLH